MRSRRARRGGLRVSRSAWIWPWCDRRHGRVALFPVQHPGMVLIGAVGVKKPGVEVNVQLFLPGYLILRAAIPDSLPVKYKYRGGLVAVSKVPVNMELLPPAPGGPVQFELHLPDIPLQALHELRVGYHDPAYLVCHADGKPQNVLIIAYAGIEHTLYPLIVKAAALYTEYRAAALYPAAVQIYSHQPVAVPVKKPYKISAVIRHSVLTEACGLKHILQLLHLTAFKEGIVVRNIAALPDEQFRICHGINIEYLPRLPNLRQPQQQPPKIVHIKDVPSKEVKALVPPEHRAHAAYLHYRLALALF